MKRDGRGRSGRDLIVKAELVSDSQLANQINIDSRLKVTLHPYATPYYPTKYFNVYLNTLNYIKYQYCNKFPALVIKLTKTTLRTISI